MSYFIYYAIIDAAYSKLKYFNNYKYTFILSFGHNSRCDTILPFYIPDFNFDDWKKEAIDKKWQINEDGEEITTIKWKAPDKYQQTRWFRFQEAIKKYQKQTLAIYKNSVYSKLPQDLLEEIMAFK